MSEINPDRAEQSARIQIASRSARKLPRPGSADINDRREEKMRAGTETNPSA